MKQFGVVLMFLSHILFGQELAVRSFDVLLMPVGGAADVAYVFQSQVIFPDVLLKQKSAYNVAIYFDVSATGSINNVNFKNSYPLQLQVEAMRILRYFNFKPAKIVNVAVPATSFLIFKFDPTQYKKIIKKREFDFSKNMALFDTTFTIYERADKSPEYFKGDDALSEFILSNLEYPDLAVRQNISGTVVVSFIVEPNGTISNLVADKEFNQLCTEEAFRIMRQIKWQPAEKNGKLVRYKMKYPIIFNLNNRNKDNATSEQR